MGGLCSGMSKKTPSSPAPKKGSNSKSSGSKASRASKVSQVKHEEGAEGQFKEGSEARVQHDEAAIEEERENKEEILEYFKNDFTKTFTTDNNSHTKHDEKEILKEQGYDLQRKLGSGAFATVYEAKDLKNNNATLACKVIDMSEKREKRMADLKHELYVLEKIKHNNIVKLYNHFIIDDKVYIFMQYADGGTLSDHVRKKGPLTERRSKRWFCQFSGAVQFMHKEGIAHRDLKLGNILLNRGGKEKSECVVTDFGLSRICFRKDKGVLRCSAYCGTPPYMAPEILEKDINGKRSYDPMAADIWALGVCLYAMVNKAYPFNPENMDSMIRNQREQRFKFASKQKRMLSEECKNLITNMMEPDPAKRITFLGIFSHKWCDPKYNESESSAMKSKPQQ